MDPTEVGLSGGTIYHAGERAPAGQYARIDRPGAVVTLTQFDRLPASFDGTIAIYAPIVRVTHLVKS